MSPLRVIVQLPPAGLWVSPQLADQPANDELLGVAVSVTGVPDG